MHDARIVGNDPMRLVVRHNRLLSAVVCGLAFAGCLVAAPRNSAAAAILFLIAVAFGADAIRRRDVIIDRLGGSVTVVEGRDRRVVRFTAPPSVAVREVVFHGIRRSSTWEVELIGAPVAIGLGRFSTERAARRFADELTARLH